MATRKRLVSPHPEEMGAENPTSAPDPRFDPATDEENALAHELQSGGPEQEPELDLQGVVKGMLLEAVRHYEDELEPEQAKATDYYKGRPFGDEKEGRSKVVSTDVRDATMAQMPSILRVIFGPEKVVEFEPEGPEDEEIARQQTDGCNYAITRDNPGFRIFHDCIQDGLVRRLGVVKWWWNEDHRVKATEYTGLTEVDVAVLLQEESTQELEITAQYPLAPVPGSPMLFNATLTRKEDKGRVRVAAVPPEEFICTPNARDLDTAPLVAHVRDVASDELLAMGVHPDVVEKYRGQKRDVSSEDLDVARQFNDTDTRWRDADGDLDPSQRPILYAEAYCLVDGDGDGIAERRLFKCVGPDYEIVNGDGKGEIVDEVPFACWSPYPEAHTIVGDSNYDLLGPLQRINSQVQRLMLDSFNLAVNTKLGVVQGQVNMADVLNDELAGIIRMRQPGMVQEIGHTFVGETALSVLQFYKGEREDRTGTSRAAMGLDADALQSSTKAAVAATLSGSQQRLEFIVRVFAETLMTRLVRGVCGLLVKHQDQPRMMRLRNKWVPVDPRHWDYDMDLRVNVALGQGTPEEKVNALAQTLALQKELQMLGAPFVTFAHIRNTAARLTEAIGFENTDEFYGAWTLEDEMQRQQAMAQQPPPPDPNMALVQIEQGKAQMQAQMDQAKLELERWKATMEDDRERDKAAREFQLQQEKIAAENGVKIEEARLNAEVARDRATMDADVKRQQIAAQSQPRTVEVKRARAGS